jgi:hypothetical protein
MVAFMLHAGPEALASLAGEAASAGTARQSVNAANVRIFLDMRTSL